MNAIDAQVLTKIYENPGITQRELMNLVGLSLGKVNSVIHDFIEKKLITRELKFIEEGRQLIKNSKTKRAIILAAGFGMRMVPISGQITKGMLRVNGEKLIERQILQLNQCGITDITIVVGFKKEQYEYLIDKYHVKLVVNSEYSEKNNLISLGMVKECLSDCYIIPCDVYFKKNPFSTFELYSWYLLSETREIGTHFSCNKKLDLIECRSDEEGNVPIGLGYITAEDSDSFKQKVSELIQSKAHNSDFWEICLFDFEKKIISAKFDKKENAFEINNYDDLRKLDVNSPDLESEPLKIIEKSLGVSQSEIKNIQILKKGMTNRSFKFICQNKKYIMRIPGEGTEQLINRKNEAKVYESLKEFGLTDQVKYINPTNGYKLTEFIEGARNCDANNFDEVSQCMKVLRKFHELNIKVDQCFDLFGQLEFYEKLLPNGSSVYPDYYETKKNVEKLIKYVKKRTKKSVLCHIDANADNFIFFPGKNGESQLRLIDWEYAGMQDPDLDIAMFAIYAMYNRAQVDQLIDSYYVEGCSEKIRNKIYCYISISGLLWSNWCEYKSSLGVEFGEYSLWQYHYAKEYFKIVSDKQILG